MTADRDPPDLPPQPALADRSTGISLFRPSQAPARPAVILHPAQPGTDLARPPMLPQVNPGRVWEQLTAITLDEARLAQHGLFLHARSHPETAAFDILRTRLLQACEAKGWKRIAVTSPTHGCGKSFVAGNLALSLARRPGSRTVLMDLELRSPHLAAAMGLQGLGSVRDYLLGDQPMESHFRRHGRTLALCLNAEPVPDAAEVLADPATARTLEAMVEHLAPDVAIYDLPPALGSDDVLALLPQVDGVLLVTDGTRTSPEDIRHCEAIFADTAPLLGVVLNRSQETRRRRYRYGQK